MLPYWILVFVFMLFSLLDFVSAKKMDKYLYFCGLLIVLVLFSGLRYNCDADYTSYVEIYQNMPDLSEWISNLNNAAKKQTYGEPLYVALCVFLKTISAPPQYVFVLIALGTFSIGGNLIWRISKYPFTSLFMYTCLFYLAGGFTQIRFGLSAVITLQAFNFLYQNRIKLFLILVLLGAGFHVSALVGLFILPLYFLKTNKILVICMVLLGLFISFLDLNRWMLTYFFDLDTDVSYSSYLGEVEYLTRAPNTVLVLYSAVIAVFVMFKPEQLELEKYEYDMYLAASAMSIIIGGFTIQVNILSRFTVLYQMMFIFIIPLMFFQTRFKLFAWGVIVIYALIKFSQIIAPGGFIRPYDNIIFQ